MSLPPFSVTLREYSHALMSQSQEIKGLIKPASAIMGEMGRQIWYFTQMINQQIACVCTSLQESHTLSSLG